jgi:hypothetical protein
MRLLIRHRFDNLAKIDSMDAPLLVIHGKEDNIVPYSHGRTLFEAASEPKAFFELQGVHNEGFAVTAGYAEALRRFLDETIGAN